MAREVMLPEPDTEAQSEAAQSRARALSRGAPSVPGYEVERLLGVGTYGEVWLARDTRTGSHVAIKFFSHGAGERWQFLLAEVQQLASLRADPGIVRLLDVCARHDPPYYVMDVAEGGSLAQKLAKGPLPVEEAERIFARVVRTLAYVHSKGIRHCDLKPGNILLDGRGEPLLADFGQAQLSSSASPALGTFFYMPPEQASLEATVPDTRWDVYGLGAVLYTMLVGHPPYDCPEARERLKQARGIEERLQVYRSWVQSAAPPRGHYQVRGVDRGLAQILERCLALDPEERFPSAEAILAALQARARRRARRPLVLLGGLIPTVLALAGGLFVWHGIGSAVREAQNLSVRAALESNRIAARLAASAVAQEIDRRWRILENVAADPAFIQLVLQAAGSSVQQLARGPLQRRLERLHQDHAETAQATSWFVTDAAGVQIARSPLDFETLGKNFSFRDYFHGRGKDYLPQQGKAQPIERPHRSIVFISQATHTPMIALSVPIWAGPTEGLSHRQVVGVLAMTVEIGRFMALRHDEVLPRPGAAGLASTATRDGNPILGPPERLLALIDCRTDWTGTSGLILQHPALEGPMPGGAEQARLPRLDGELVQTLMAGAPVEREQFQDPLFPELGACWIAAFHPVHAPRANGSVQWAVLAEQQRSLALRPTEPLRLALIQRGLLATGVGLAAVTILWMLVLRELMRPGWP
jgi:hypothetical protein